MKEMAADPAIKSTCLLNALTARREADRSGAFEAVMSNPRGQLAEAAAANIFFVKKGVLMTPALSAGILPGITRDLVIGRAGLRIPLLGYVKIISGAALNSVTGGK